MSALWLLWPGGVMVMTLDSQLKGSQFDSGPFSDLSAWAQWKGDEHLPTLL